VLLLEVDEKRRRLVYIDGQSGLQSRMTIKEFVLVGET
jgi:hypothetical protein